MMVTDILGRVDVEACVDQEICDGMGNDVD